MQDVTTKAAATICDGGFRIEIGPDELTVARDRTAAKPRTGAIAFRIFAIVALAAMAYKLVSDSLPTLVDAPLTVLAVAAVLIVLVVISMRRARNDNLHCTRKNLEVIRETRGRASSQRVVARARVRQVSFTAVSWSTSGPTFALVFKVDGKEIEVLRGIESPEAQTVLRELQRLGYDVEFDVGMAMMVEMAIERRRSGEE